MTDQPPRARASHRWLLLIVACAAVLRFVPIWFGLPYEYPRPDEEVAIGHAVNVLGGAYNPEFFHWPSLTFYLLAGCFWLGSAVRRIVGLGVPTYVTDLLIARATIATAGTATVALAYLLSRRISNAPTALTAAAFLAVAPLHVRDSHFAMTDVLATFFIVWTLVLLLRAMETRSTGGFALAGLVAGLAASTKYSAGAVAASMVVAQLILVLEEAGACRVARRWFPSVAFFSACVGGFLLGTPYALLDRREFLEGLAYDFTHLSEGHNGLKAGVGWTYHLARSLPAAMGWPLFVASLVGIVPMAFGHRRPAAVVGAFCVALYICLGPGHTLFFRYVLPLVPFLCVSAAIAVRWTRVPLLAWAVAAPALVTCVWSDVLLARPDTRLLAEHWLVDHVKPGESLYQAGSNYADAPLGPLLSQTWPRAMFDAESKNFVGGAIPDWLIIPQSPLGLYTTVPPSLRQMASDRYEIAHRIRATTPGRRDQGLYDADDAFFLPVTGFSAIVRPGPTFVIYRRVGLR